MAACSRAPRRAARSTRLPKWTLRESPPTSPDGKTQATKKGPKPLFRVAWSALLLLGATAGRPVLVFFLGCVIVAGVYGAITVSRRIFFVQAVPANQAGFVTFSTPENFITQLLDWAAQEPEGGAIERDKPHKQKMATDTASLSEAERRQREKLMLEQIKQRMKRSKND